MALMMPPLPVINLNLEVEEPHLLDGPNMEAFKRELHQGAMWAGEHIRGVWLLVALQHGLKNSGGGSYIAGIMPENSRIEVEEVKVTGDLWSVTLAITNTSPIASLVEHGHGGFHLPSKINWSAGTGSIKMGSKGPYLHIPFGHSAYQSPSARASGGQTRSTLARMMPNHIYQKAKRLTATRRLNVGPIHKAGRFIAADRYNWGGKLDRSHTKPQIHLGVGANASGAGNAGYEEHRGARNVGKDAKGNPITNPAWGSSKFHNMFRTEHPKAGGGQDSKYTTIRTITPRSLGWNIPARQGLFIARGLANTIASDAKLRDLITMGMKSALPGAK